MQRTSQISLIFDDNGSFHDDLMLQIGDKSWRCDSYYLLIDNLLLPRQEDAQKVVIVLKRLLAQWSAALTDLTDSQSCYLPYDFSDQHTGWLRCECRGSDIRVEKGWSDLNGYSFLPSEVGELLHRVPNFRPDPEVFVILRDDFLRSIATVQND